MWPIPLVTASIVKNMKGTKRPRRIRNIDKLSKRKGSLGTC